MSMTSAASTDSPDLKVLSTVLPVLRFLMRTRLNAWPLPGLTNSFSTITHGIVVDDDAQTAAELVGAVIGHDYRSGMSGRPVAARRYDTGVRGACASRIFEDRVCGRQDRSRNLIQVTVLTSGSGLLYLKCLDSVMLTEYGYRGIPGLPGNRI